MEVVTVSAALRQPTTGQLKRLLFDTKRRRRWFINARILERRLSNDPLERTEQRPELGAVIVWAAAPYDGAPRVDHMIMREALLVGTDELDAKRGDALAWLKSVCARGVDAAVVSYTLTDDERDFASLELVPVPWLPESINTGDRIEYHGAAHPIPGARGLRVDVDGVFEITGSTFGLDGRLWWEIHDIKVGDDLYINEPLLLTATFIDDLDTIDAKTG